jgi:DNA-binding CsgD family transcriptional regulator
VPAVRARAFADRAVLTLGLSATGSMGQAQQALAIAREVDDPTLVARALAACGVIAVVSGEAAGPYFAEAIGLARELDDRWTLSQLLGFQAIVACTFGDPIAARVAAEEGLGLADAIGDRFNSRRCCWSLGWAQMISGDPAGAVAQFGAVVAQAEAAHDVTYKVYGLGSQAMALAYLGDTGEARAAADAAVETAGELGGIPGGLGYTALGVAALAAGDVGTALDATEAAGPHMGVLPGTAAAQRAFGAQAALAGGDLIAARRLVADVVTTTKGWFLMLLLTARACVAIAEGEPERAERDAHDALGCAAEVEAYLSISDTLECLAALADDSGSHREATRLLGAAHGIRQRIGTVRFKAWDASYENSLSGLRNALGDKDFDSAWAEGAALSVEEAIAYAQRGRGERKRPTSGWESLTPSERDVVRLLSEGLANNDIATRLFISRRTVQTHLTHVYTKLGLTSRVDLAREAARHS